MKRAIEPIVIGKRARKRVGDVNELARSIRETGLLHPIVIDDKNQLIAGQRRLKACKSLGWERVPVHVVPLDDILRGEFDENVVREDFLPSEMYAISKNLEERERKAAKERQGGRGRKRSAKLAEKSESMRWVFAKSECHKLSRARSGSCAARKLMRRLNFRFNMRLIEQPCQQQRRS